MENTRLYQIGDLFFDSITKIVWEIIDFYGMTEEGENNYLARMKHDLKGKNGAIRNYLDCPINKPQEWDEIDITEAGKPFNIEDYLKPNN